MIAMGFVINHVSCAEQSVNPIMKYFGLGVLSCVLALTSAPSRYGLDCDFPAAVYEDGTASGTCLKSNDQTSAAPITDKCANCPEIEFQLGARSHAASPPPAGIIWHKDSQKFWALFQIKNYPEEIKALRVYSTSWDTLIPTPWHEYNAPTIDIFVMHDFRIEIEGVSNNKHQYLANFPYADMEPPQSDTTYYPGPVFQLTPA